MDNFYLKIATTTKVFYKRKAKQAEENSGNGRGRKKTARKEKKKRKVMAWTQCKWPDSRKRQQVVVVVVASLTTHIIECLKIPIHFQFFFLFLPFNRLWIRLTNDFEVEVEVEVTLISSLILFCVEHFVFFLLLKTFSTVLYLYLNDAVLNYAANCRKKMLNKIMKNLCRIRRRKYGVCS